MPVWALNGRVGWHLTIESRTRACTGRSHASLLSPPSGGRGRTATHSASRGRAHPGTGNYWAIQILCDLFAGDQAERAGTEVSADEKKPEPKWISDLARVASVAQRMERRSKGTFGAANKGKRLMAWFCACGWEGSSQELKAGQNGLACPMCGGGELKAR
jgi:hypothetical protein